MGHDLGHLPAERSLWRLPVIGIEAERDEHSAEDLLTDGIVELVSPFHHVVLALAGKDLQTDAKDGILLLRRSVGNSVEDLEVVDAVVQVVEPLTVRSLWLEVVVEATDLFPDVVHDGAPNLLGME